jgi:hypothetical protein
VDALGLAFVVTLNHARNMPTSMIGGKVHGVARHFYPIRGHRPTPDLARYAVPDVERLYPSDRSCIRAEGCMVPAERRR